MTPSGGHVSRSRRSAGPWPTYACAWVSPTEQARLAAELHELGSRAPLIAYSATGQLRSFPGQVPSSVRDGHRLHYLRRRDHLGRRAVGSLWRVRHGGPRLHHRCEAMEETPLAGGGQHADTRPQGGSAPPGRSRPEKLPAPGLRAYTIAGARITEGAGVAAAIVSTSPSRLRRGCQSWRGPLRPWCWKRSDGSTPATGAGQCACRAGAGATGLGRHCGRQRASRAGEGRRLHGHRRRRSVTPVRADRLSGRIISVLSRRAPAFQPATVSGPPHRLFDISPG